MDVLYRDSITEFLNKHLGKVEVTETKPLYGGSINHVYLLHLKPQHSQNIPHRVVVKTNTGRPAGFLKKEADGLEHLFKAVNQYRIDIRIPKPLAIGTLATGNLTPNSKPVQVLAMEFIPQSTHNPPTNVWKAFGYNLARLHRETSDTEGKENHPKKYGWHENTFIGNNIQHNTSKGNWVEFFSEYRLIPQMNWGEQNRLLPQATMKKLDRVIKNLDRYLPSHPPASLLHGDLWTGNAFFSEKGEPVIFDPAVYFGHGETDLAMTELFGSFPATFYQGYHSIFPQDPETGLRKVLYNLYHLLNHLNLFGSSYLSSVEHSLDRILKYSP